MPAVKRVFLFSVVVILFFFTLPHRAYSYFSEDFSNISLNELIWEKYDNGGNFTFDNGSLRLSSPYGNSFPYFVNKYNIFPETGPFSIEYKFKYFSAGSFGTGITISTNTAPPNTVDPGSNIPAFIAFSSWQSSVMGLYYQKYMCNIYGSQCNQLSLINTITSGINFNDHIVRIDYSELGQYSIYVDDFTNPKFVSGLNQQRPKKIWIGNSILTNTFDYWSSFEIDYIRVLQEIQRNPVILLPGFGGSWDIGAILSGTSGNNWQVPMFVKNYDGILKSLRNAGYEDGMNLFVFPYDWRKPLDILADDLNSFITSHDLSEVNLIGHSMGGLVSRAYAQKYGISKIENILSIGSPHLGVVDAYGLWEGAKIWNGVWWENVLLEIASEINRMKDELKVDAVRRVSPSILDLFPTYPFLKLNSVLVGIDSMYEKNDYLRNLNSDISVLGNKLTAFWSDQIDETKNMINIEPRIKEDRIKNMWVDGRPVGEYPFENSSGDGTITGQSAVGPFNNDIELTGWHGDLLSTQSNNQKIFEKLGLDSTLALSSASDNRKNSFVAILRSPGELQVCDVQFLLCNEDLGLYFPEYKLFILPGYAGEELVVKVKELGSGGYRLHIGNIDETPDWLVFNGILKYSGQEDVYQIKGDGDSIMASFVPGNREVCKKNGWSAFRLLGFRNQGDCVSFVESRRTL